jgi:hypothetical protein
MAKSKMPKKPKKPAVRLPARSEYVEGHEDQPPAENPEVKAPPQSRKPGQPVNLNKRPR